MKIKGLKVKKKIIPEGIMLKFIYKIEENIFTSVNLEDVFTGDVPIKDIFKREKEIDGKIPIEWFKKWRKEFPEDAKKLDDELTFMDIPEKYREDVIKMTEKAIEKFAKIFHIHISGDLNKHKLDIDELLKFAEESDNKIKKELKNV